MKKLVKLSKYQLKFSLNQLKSSRQIIALDLGTQSTGVAISCPDLKEAFLLDVIAYPSKTPAFYKRLKTILQQNQARGLIVGDTVYEEANKRHASILEELDKHLNHSIPFIYVDETATTRESKDILSNLSRIARKQSHQHDQKSLEDGLAAILILQRFLMYYNNQIKSEDL